MILWYIIISLISGSLVFDYISSPSVSMHHSTFADFEDNFHFARSGCATGDIYWVKFYYACICSLLLLVQVINFNLCFYNPSYQCATFIFNL